MPSAPASAALLAGLALAGAVALAPTAPGGPGAPPPAVPGVPPGVAGPARPDSGAVVGYSWPLRPAPEVLRGFDVLPSRYVAGHRGADLAAPVGAEVLAAAAGTVTFAGQVAGRGVVVVAHADGLRTTYEPLLPAVAAGSAVAGGAVLGTVAAAPAHCPGRPCLHWGARRGADHVDPLTLLRGAAPVLLPLGRPG